LLVYGIPGVYLSLKNLRKIPKVARFTFWVCIPVAVICELVASGDRAWTVPKSILPYRFFGIIPVEDFVWILIVTYTVLMYYEHFQNNQFQSTMSLNRMLLLLDPLCVAVMLVFMWNRTLLSIHYAFALLGLVLFIIPLALFFNSAPYLFATFVKTDMFFIYCNLVFELVGLKLNHWSFDGTHYIGWIRILGLNVPLEELVFVIILGAFVACAYYEYCTLKAFPASHSPESR
jgi:hypothetical protein